MSTTRESSTQPHQRREQATFTKEEKNFLNTFLPLYLATFDSAGGDGSSTSKKGDKKDWVLDEVYPKFATKFNSDGPDGPNLDSLKTKMVRYFTNRKGQTTVSKVAIIAKKPRATNGLEVFAKEKKSEIQKKMAEKRNEGSAPPDNITLYKHARDEMWTGLKAEGQAEFEARALEQNNEIGKGPTEEDIQRNRENIVLNTINALQSLIGIHWKGHGDIVFFVQGAYRTSDARVDSFTASVGPNTDMKSFHDAVPNFKEVFQKPFKTWARSVLPKVAVDSEETSSRPAPPPNAPPAASVSLLNDGFPVLCDVNKDGISPSEAKQLLFNYVTTAWTCAIPKNSNVLVPWDILNSTARSQILDNPIPFLPFKSLDPSRASLQDIYGVLETILLEQQKNERPLKFTVTREMLHCISTDQEKALKLLTEAIDSAAVTLSPSKPNPPASKKKKGRKSKKTVISDSEQFDFSPNIPGSIPIAPIVPNALPAAPSQPLAPTAMTQPPTSPLATTPALDLNQSMAVDTEVLDHAPASPAKCKDPVDTDHNSSAPSKKKKNDPIPAAKKSPTRKLGTKSKLQASSPVPGASIGSPAAAVSETGGGKTSSDKLPPAPRERSERIHGGGYQNRNVNIRPHGQ